MLPAAQAFMCYSLGNVYTCILGVKKGIQTLVIFADMSMTLEDSLPSRWWPSFSKPFLGYHLTPWIFFLPALSLACNVWAYFGWYLCVQPLLLDHCGLFFVPLSLALVNDDSARCKKMASLAIRSLLGQLDVQHQNSMFTLVSGWMTGEKVTEDTLISRHVHKCIYMCVKKINVPFFLCVYTCMCRWLCEDWVLRCVGFL